MKTATVQSIAFACCLAAHSASAGPLTEARITKVISEVHLVDGQSKRSAAINDLVKDDLTVTTGVKSRSELRFQDDTLTRIGPESSFSFKAGTRDLTLGAGTMLLQVPKGLGGATIRTAAVTAAITGTTIMLEYRPAKQVKVLVLEGSLRLSINGKFGEQTTLHPGEMIMMPPDAKRLPEVVHVDIAQVMRTSSLVKMGKNGGSDLPSSSLIANEVTTQEKEKANRTLVPTDFTVGSGTNVTVANEFLEVANRTRDAQPESLAVHLPPVATPASTPAALGIPLPVATPTAAPTAAPVASATPSPAPTPAATATPVALPSVTPSPSASPAIAPSPTPHDGDDDGDGGGKKKKKRGDDGDKKDDGDGGKPEKAPGAGGLHLAGHLRGLSASHLRVVRSPKIVHVHDSSELAEMTAKPGSTSLGSPRAAVHSNAAVSGSKTGSNAKGSSRSDRRLSALPTMTSQSAEATRASGGQ